MGCRLWGRTESDTTEATQQQQQQQQQQQTQVQSLGQEDPLEEEVATHSSVLAWRMPWTEELGRLQSIWSQRIGHD